MKELLHLQCINVVTNTQITFLKYLLLELNIWYFIRTNGGVIYFAKDIQDFINKQTHTVERTHTYIHKIIF